MKHFKKAVKALRSDMEFHDKKLKLSDDVIRAWIELCVEKTKANQILQNARPKPVITKVGLSPKVTKTLKEMDLDLDLSTIQHPIVYRMVPLTDEKGKLIRDANKKKIMVLRPFVQFPDGTVFNMTRFSLKPHNCEACGKFVPSGMFTPLVAKDKKSGKLVGMWVGTDCGRNIFGIKDLGFNRGKDNK